MTTLKQGDLIKDKNGVTRKVMGVCGTALHISRVVDFNKYWQTSDEESLKEARFTWDTPAWEPSYGTVYWYINNDGDAYEATWSDNDFDHARRDFLGIYQTKELCEAALLEIRRKLEK